MTDWIAFGVATVAAMLLASGGYGKARSARDFFHIPGARRNLIALSIADITLGTGVVYLLTASAVNGLSFLAIPFATMLGYFLYARFMASMSKSGVLVDGNLLLGVRSAFVRELSSSRWFFDGLVTIPLILIFLFVFAFELFASSAIIAAFIDAEHFALAQLVVAGALFVVSYVNAIGGGMQASWRNDTFLAVSILSFFGLIVVASVLPVAELPTRKPPALLLWGTAGMPAALAAVGLGCINAVATQFYSLLNGYSATNFGSEGELRRTMTRVGVVVFSLLSVLVAVGAFFPLSDLDRGLPQAIALQLENLIGEGPISTIIKGIIIIGMAAIVLSTIDTLMIALSYFTYRNVLDLSEERNPTSPRLVLSALFAIGFLPLAGMILVRPSLFYLLLGIAGGAAVYAILLVGLGQTIKLTGRPPRAAQVAIIFSFLVFLAVGILTVSASAHSAYKLIPMFAIGGLACATLVNFLVWLRR